MRPALAALALCLAAATAAPAARPAAPAYRPPAVRALCDPCRVEPGAVVALKASVRASDPRRVKVAWTAASGTLTVTDRPDAAWTAPGSEGPVPIVVVVTDARGATASDVVTIQVAIPKPPGSS